MDWTPKAFEAELRRLEPVSRELGLQTPFKRARFLIAQEEDWGSDEVQQRWQSRIDYWREVLLGEEAGLPWGDLLDLYHPGLLPLLGRFEAGGEEA